MKRIRTEQLQTTTLLYLKKRKFTESDTTFRQSFKFALSPLETASNLIKKNLISNVDMTAMTSQCLDEYFLGFKAFQEFIASITRSKKSSNLEKLLCPVFLHGYLDLVVADRLQEAEEFYNLFFDDNIMDPNDDFLVQLQKVKVPNDLSKVPVMNKFRNKFFKIDLSCDDKELLLRFLYGQENLIVMKIINERICFGNTDKSSTECITTEELLTAKKAFTEKKRRISELRVQEIPTTQNSDQTPVIISSPSLQQSLVPSKYPRSFTPEKVSIHVTVDESLLKNQIKFLRTSQATVQALHLFNFNDPDDSITTSTLSNNKQYLSCCREDSVVMLWNVASCAEHICRHENESKVPDVSVVSFGDELKSDVHYRINKLTKQKFESFQNNRVTLLQAHSGSVYSSAFTHDDKFLLTCSEDTTIRLWDLHLLNNRAIFCGHNYPVLSLCVSAFSLYFASGSMDTTARLWSLERTFPIRIFAGHEHSIEATSFHSNASYLASADHTIRLWDINSGKTVRLMLGHWAPVTALAFSPDGKLLASAGEDCRIKIWDIASGNMLKEIRSHTDTIYSISFSPDSSLLSSCGADSIVNVWSTTFMGAISGIDAITSSSRKSGANGNPVAQWNVNNCARKTVFSQFSGDLLNCIAIS